MSQKDSYPQHDVGIFTNVVRNVMNLLIHTLLSYFLNQSLLTLISTSSIFQLTIPLVLFTYTVPWFRYCVLLVHLLCSHFNPQLTLRAHLSCHKHKLDHIHSLHKCDPLLLQEEHSRSWVRHSSRRPWSTLSASVLITSLQIPFIRVLITPQTYQIHILPLLFPSPRIFTFI